MAIKQHRPVMCYGCGQSLGTVETTLGPEGMKKFREEAKRLKEQHRCGEHERKER